MRSPAFRASKEKFGIDRYSPSLKLFLPLWYTGLQGSPFESLDINRHICTVTGALWGSQGRTFDGDDYLTIGNLLNIGTNPVTFGCWAKITGTSTVMTLMGKKNSASNYGGYCLIMGDGQVQNTGKIQTVFRNASGTQDATAYASAYNDSKWHFFIGGRDGTNVFLDADGVPLTPVADNALNTDNTRPYDIGSQNDGTVRSGFVVGTIGECFQYSRGFSFAERTNLYLATKWRYV